ncbi:MAG: OadG family protein [Planctomycetes bacterium]|nr:OadG family protein [Planctomycetota bacterium]
MIGNSILLMFVGMGVVFLFLVLLNIAISLLAYLTREHTRMEEAVLREEELARRQKKKKKGGKAEDSGTYTAVIAAAIHAYRNA